MTNVDFLKIGEDVPLLEGLRTTRAIRRLKPDPVPIGLVKKVCEAGTYAPSGGNRQPWFFVAVMDIQKRAKIANLYRSTFREYIIPAKEAAESPEYPKSKKLNMNAAIYLAEHMHETPVLLFVAGWTRRGQPQSQALFPAIQNILLACRAVGLGASLTTAHRAHGEEIDSLIGLNPEKTPTIAMIPIGWPKGRYGKPTRRSIDNCFFVDSYKGDTLT